MGLCDHCCVGDGETLNGFYLIDPEFELQKLDGQIKGDIFYDNVSSFFRKHTPTFYDMFSRN